MTKKENTSMIFFTVNLHGIINARLSLNSLTTAYPATVDNLFLRIRRSLKINAQLNQE